MSREPNTLKLVRADDGDDSATARAASEVEHVHLRLRPADAAVLRELARARDQTLSGAVRHLLRPFRGRAKSDDL